MTRALILLAAVLLPGGCVTTSIEEFQQSRAVIGTEDRIVVLGRRQANSHETEMNFVTCVGDALSEGEKPMSVIPETRFLDALFPWFEPRTAPLDTNDLPDFLVTPQVAEAIERLELRYLVWLDGSTNTTDQTGTLTCSVGPGAAGCLGFLTWEQGSAYEASIWDLHTHRDVGRISTDSSGTSYMPALVVPIPIIAPVQTIACSNMANQIRKFFISSS